MALVAGNGLAEAEGPVRTDTAAHPAAGLLMAVRREAQAVDEIAHEPLAELRVAAIERGPRLHPRLAGEVHHSEEEISDLVGESPARRRAASHCINSTPVCQCGAARSRRRIEVVRWKGRLPTTTCGCCGNRKRRMSSLTNRLAVERDLVDLSGEGDPVSFPEPRLERPPVSRGVEQRHVLVVVADCARRLAERPQRGERGERLVVERRDSASIGDGGVCVPLRGLGGLQLGRRDQGVVGGGPPDLWGKRAALCDRGLREPGAPRVPGL